MDQRRFWEQRYGEGRAVWGDRPSAVAEEAAARCVRSGARRILVIGCGYGRNCGAFARPGVHVVGFDFAASGLALARASAAPGNPVSWCRGDARALPFTAGAFDAVAALHLIHLLDLPGRASMVAEAARVTRAGGLFLATVFSRADPECPGEDGDGEPFTVHPPDGKRSHFFDEAELRALLGDLRRVEIDRITEPGTLGGSAILRRFLWIAGEVGVPHDAAR
jgi:SAM-dependent methyltransferase